MPDKFPYVRRGYDPAMVDRKIDELELQIREYREKDASISNAIMSAQLAADEITRKSHAAAEAIVENARAASIQLTESSRGQIEAIIDAVKEQRLGLIQFKEDYEALLSKYFLAIDVSEIATADKKAGELEAYLQKYLNELNAQTLLSPENDELS